MSLFEWLQTCSIEEFAEWLVAFQDQCEENIIEQFISAGCDVTKVYFTTELLCDKLRDRMVNYLSEEINDGN